MRKAEGTGVFKKFCGVRVEARERIRPWCHELLRPGGGMRLGAIRKYNVRAWGACDEQHFAIHTGVCVGHLGGVHHLFEFCGGAGCVWRAAEPGSGWVNGGVLAGASALYGDDRGGAVRGGELSACAVAEDLAAAGDAGRDFDVRADGDIADAGDAAAGRTAQGDGFGGCYAEG